MSCFSSNQGIVAWLEKKTGPVAVDLTDVKAAEKLGYTNVQHYSKGIMGWKKAGETTEKGK